jgi:ABC-2 type transport system permease protein
MYNLAFKALSLVVLAPVWLVLVVLFQPDFSAVSLDNLLLAIPALIMGFLINFFFGATLTSIAFWTTRVYSLAEFIWAFSMILGGIFVPLDLLPKFAQQVALLLPFQLCNYFPIQLILGRLAPTQLLFNLAMQIFWLLLLVILFRQTWRAGLKRYSAVGA